MSRRTVVAFAAGLTMLLTSQASAVDHPTDAGITDVASKHGVAESLDRLESILKAKGIKARLLDLSGFDDDEPLTIDERIHESFKGVDPQKEVVVVTGYTKGVEGIMREFDRGYSEVTFSKVAVELRPAEAIIHKEFHLSSADPAIVGAGNTVVVGMTNYDVADQLADVGMEAIHPKAAKPMELAGIAIRLKNTFEPAHPDRPRWWGPPRPPWRRNCRYRFASMPVFWLLRQGSRKSSPANLADGPDWLPAYGPKSVFPRCRRSPGTCPRSGVPSFRRKQGVHRSPTA